jgi:molybdopterin-guanine dinucleotide biosynthesis protein B
LLKTPVVAVVGEKKSGKTTVIESVVRLLSAKGYRTCVFKHVSEPDFSIDTPGKDSWRFVQAGAQTVLTVAHREVATVRSVDTSSLDLSQILAYAGDGYDLILLEGFKGLVEGDERIPKIVTASTPRAAEARMRECKSVMILDVQGCQTGPILGIPCTDFLKDPSGLAEFVEDDLIPLIETARVWQRLPDLDCGKCGYATCRDMAGAVARGEDIGKCDAVSGPSSLTALIDSKRVPMKEFVQEIIRKSVLGMLSSLKGTEVDGTEDVTISVRKRS